MRIRLAVPDRHVGPDILDAALEATTRAALAQLEAGEAPDIREGIKRGVRWRPEPFTDGEHFDLPSVVMGRKFGDCDDLAPWLAASLRASGEDPGAVAMVRKSGPKTWHVVVRTSSGEVLDPSKWAGMKSRQGVSGAHAIRRMVAPGHGGFALTRVNGTWAARADLPWPESDSHVASIARDRSPDRAVARAICGAALCGDALDASHAGKAWELADELTSDASSVGSFLDDLVSTAASAIPGGSLALNAARGLFGGSPAAPPSPGPGGQPYGTAALPSGAQLSYPMVAPGPVIVRF